MAKEYKMYINGEWVAAADGTTFDDRNPYTGDVYAKVASGKAEDAKRAVDGAAEAFPGWAATLPGERAMYFLKAAGPPAGGCRPGTHGHRRDHPR
jgi:acyl-CoA reductase-like NAD-dependent aldehyde dehydrogenase